MRNRGAFFIYILLSGMSSLSYSMIFTIELIYQINVVELNPLQLTLVGSAQQSINFLLQVPTGLLADMYSRRRVVVLGLFLVGVGYLVEGLFSTFAIILIAASVGGLGATLVSGADAAWIADEMGAERVGPVYIQAAQFGSLASLLGIGISALLVNVRLNLPIILGGGLFIVLSLVLAFIMPERHFIPAQRQGRGTSQQMVRTLKDGISLLRLRPVLLTILVISVFYGMFTAGFDRLWPYHLQRSFVFPPLRGLTWAVWFCIIEAGIAATNWIGIGIVRRYVDPKSQQAVAWALFAVDGLQVAGVVGFALAGQFFLALAIFFLFTTVAGPRLSLEQAWMNQNLASGVRATMFSLRGQINAIAQIAGGPLIGLIATLTDSRIALVATGIILAPTLLLYAYILRRKQNVL